MSTHRPIKLFVFAACLLAGSAMQGLAADLDSTANPQVVQPASMESTQVQSVKPDQPATSNKLTYVRTAEFTPQAIRQAGDGRDALHADRRWPQLENCINATNTPEAFNSCLASALLQDSTGAAASLLGR